MNLIADNLSAFTQYNSDESTDTCAFIVDMQSVKQRVFLETKKKENRVLKYKHGQFFFSMRTK